LKLSSQFGDTTGTCTYLPEFNKLFDRMNSRNPFGTSLKSPLSEKTKCEIFGDFKSGTEFILSLTHTDFNEPVTKKMKSDGKLVVCGARKKGFLGFLVNIKSYQKLYELYVQTNHLKYLLTFKTSQDHVELLFCSIRGSLGGNNNPTSMEFTNNLKKILIGATHQSNFSNCLIQDDTQVLVAPLTLEESFKVYEAEEKGEDDSWIQQYLDCKETASEFKNDVLCYIAGFVQKKILDKEQCIDCKAYLANMKIVETSTLLNLKNRGCLCIPSAEVVKVVKVVNSLLDHNVQKPNFLVQKDLVERISTQCAVIINSQYPNVFKELAKHSLMTNNHQIIMIRQIARKFLTVTLHHLCKKNNNKDNKVRSLYSKLILFKNQ